MFIARILLPLLFAVTPLLAAEFKSEKECVIGSKVADRENLTGKIVSVESAQCRVLRDSTGKTETYLFWMLHAVGDSAETNDKLVVGEFQCYVGGTPSGKMRITGEATYESSGKAGKFRMEPSRKIVFETGPFSAYKGKLLAGPRIGLNRDGGAFYNMTCDPIKKRP